MALHHGASSQTLDSRGVLVGRGQHRSCPSALQARVADRTIPCVVSPPDKGDRLGDQAQCRDEPVLAVGEQAEGVEGGRSRLLVSMLWGNNLEPGAGLTGGRLRTKGGGGL